LAAKDSSFCLMPGDFSGSRRTLDNGRKDHAAAENFTIIPSEFMAGDPNRIKN
jgi:hypothetical protein